MAEIDIVNVQLWYPTGTIAPYYYKIDDALEIWTFPAANLAQ